MKMQNWVILLGLIGIIQGEIITTGPSSLTEAIGATAEFECEIDFEGGIQTMQWQFKEEIIYSIERNTEDFPLGQEKYSVTRAGKVFKLMVMNLDFASGGNYTCRTISDSVTALLIVLGRPQLSITALSHMEGDSVEYICQAQFAGPAKDETSTLPQFQMHIDGVPLQGMIREQVPEGPRNYYQWTVVHRLTLETHLNEKEMMCLISTTNPAMNLNVSTEINVLYSVRNISHTPKGRQYDVGTLITCTAKGNPQPDFVWDNIRNTGKFADSINGETLPVTAHMVGSNSWRCTASNNVSGILYQDSIVADFDAVFPQSEGSGNSSWKIGLGVAFAVLLVGMIVTFLYYRIKHKRPTCLLSRNTADTIDPKCVQPMLDKKENDTPKDEDNENNSRDEDDTEMIHHNQIENENWFHGILPLELMEYVLRQEGDYLVTYSKKMQSNEKQYELMYKRKEEIANFPIENRQRKWFYEENDSYNTVTDLVQSLSNQVEVAFKRPVARKKWELNSNDVCLPNHYENDSGRRIFKAKLLERDVAVKVFEDSVANEQRAAFLKECQLLINWKHSNIAKFTGITVTEQPLIIVMEPGCRMLPQFLHEHGKAQSMDKLVSMCKDVAAAMTYIHKKKYVLRNLASHNCLIGEDNSIKVSNFIMAKKLRRNRTYEAKSEPVYQVQWAAPEALRERKYTFHSDVWSFGVLMWEIFSLGKIPYQEIGEDKLLSWIDEGNRLHSPRRATDFVYNVMQECWNIKPSLRPTFDNLGTSLKMNA